MKNNLHCGEIHERIFFGENILKGAVGKVFRLMTLFSES